MRYTYTAYGLNIDSPMELPELMAAEKNPNVKIEFGPIPDKIENAVVSNDIYQAKPDEFLLIIKDIAKFLISSGNKITIEPALGAAQDEIRLFLLGSAVGALLHQRNMLPLHASSIEVNGKCVLFCGASGDGKSTIAGEFHQRGYALRSDDVSVIFINQQLIPLVYPAYPQLKLCEDILKINDGVIPSYRRIPRDLNKYAVPTEERFSRLPLPLKKIYILSPGNATAVNLHPVTGREKFQVLQNHTYRYSMIEGLGKKVTHFKNTSAVGKIIPVVRVRRPQNIFRLNEMADLLEKDFLRED